MCLTAYSIDKKWNLQKRILIFSPISNHKGGDMEIVITKCLLDWGLDKVFTIIVDNASSNDTTAKEMSNQFNKWGSNFDMIMDQPTKKIWDSLELSIGPIMRRKSKRFKEALEELVWRIQEANMSTNERDDFYGGHYNVIQVKKELKGEKNTSQHEKSHTWANRSKLARPSDPGFHSCVRDSP